MATGGADKVVKLWDPATGANTGSLRVCFFFLVDTIHAAFADLPVSETLLRPVCSVHDTCTASRPMTENSVHVIALHSLASFADQPCQTIHDLCVVRLSGLLLLRCGACQRRALLQPALITLPQVSDITAAAAITIDA